ncbi:Monocarboxylate transporter 14 [Mizuhopecten yessoensis]|uniref:Monocarboxylate transporter 14 n=1 Tax=Mizuhopecten yessoensis TaxID=6573 RepID=A0A210PPA5_MIZYE|nr:Monocarboxylate transporter 14 [Mizuhopecten yessoensis]
MSLTKPDKGWAWVVMMASFCMVSILGFLVYGYGMVQVALLERFHEGIAKTSIAGSLFTGFLSCAGVLDGLLVTRSSCRLMAIGGGIVMTTGIFISAFMKSVNWIIFTYGVVAGVGAGIQYTAVFIAIGYNFERNVNLALGFALSGSGIETLVFTPVFTYLTTVYSLEGLCSCVSRSLAGLACNSKVIDEPTLLSGTLAITGVFTVTLPLYGHTFTGQIVFAIAVGLYAGCAPAIMNGITLRYLSISYLDTAVGVELAFMGCGVMTGPPAIGNTFNISILSAFSGKNLGMDMRFDDRSQKT